MTGKNYDQRSSIRGYAVKVESAWQTTGRNGTAAHGTTGETPIEALEKRGGIERVWICDHYREISIAE
jgi:hypothetical protein